MNTLEVGEVKDEVRPIPPRHIEDHPLVIPTTQSWSEFIRNGLHVKQLHHTVTNKF